MGRALHLVNVGQDSAGYWESSCDSDGTVLASRRDQAAAERAGSRATCPSCGSRGAQPHVGATGVATDQAIARGRR